MKSKLSKLDSCVLSAIVLSRSIRKMELSLTGFVVEEPLEANMAPIVPIVTKNMIRETISIPMTVARRYLKKDFIFSGFNEQFNCRTKTDAAKAMSRNRPRL